jgi:DNA (cytosine-5)-methyltransferase 1
MLKHFGRVVYQAQPTWALMENVPRTPDLIIKSYYYRQRIDINQAWFENVTRLRHYQFYSKEPYFLDIPQGAKNGDCDSAALANDDRPLKEVLKCQGLPPTFKNKLAFNNGITPFKIAGIKMVIGNGVPLSVGRVLASEIKRIFNGPWLQTQMRLSGYREPVNRCKCPCRRSIKPPQQHYNYNCRKRLERQRTQLREEIITWPIQK